MGDCQLKYKISKIKLVNFFTCGNHEILMTILEVAPLIHMAFNFLLQEFNKIEIVMSY